MPNDDNVIHLNPPPPIDKPPASNPTTDVQKKPNDILPTNCQARDVTRVIIEQINGLQDDINELDTMRQLLKNIFPTDTKSYRNSYVIENKVKTFTGFYSSILSYKKELNSMLFKLRAILDVKSDTDAIKQAIREVMTERSNLAMSLETNKERIKDLVRENPSLMPSKV